MLIFNDLPQRRFLLPLLVQFPINPPVAAVHDPLAGEGDERDALAFAGLEADGGAGGGVEA